MTHQRPLFLLSNDDGYEAKGLQCLIEALRPVADLLVMAPEDGRSGAGCSISAATPLRYRIVRQEPGLTLCACSGTPVDCVKVALNEFADRRPDLVVGGINHGDNSSVNTHYSGTMGVVTEGALQGIPAVAFSLCDHSANADFAPLMPYLADIALKTLNAKLPPFTCLNVNFPQAASFKGIRLCRMAHSRWEHELARREHPWGGTYFWLVGDCRELEPEADDTDRYALAHGYIAITPTQLDVTDYKLKEDLKSIFL